MIAPRLALAGLLSLIPAVILSAPARADDNWYFGIRGGLSAAESSSLDGPSNGLAGEAKHGNNIALGAALGYDLGVMRIEGEFLHLDNDVTKFVIDNDGGLGAGLVGTNAADSGRTKVNAGMLNLLYDMDFGTGFTPYLGAGLGWGKVSFNNYQAVGVPVLDDSDTGVAYQLIAGVRAAIARSLDMTADYRYFGTEDPKLIDALGRRVNADYRSHVFMIGLMWTFGGKEEVASVPAPIETAMPEPEPEPEALPQIEPAAGPEPVGPFMVYFDWDSAELTAEARAEIARAAAAAEDMAPVQLLLKGHADSSGPEYYNTPLSKRRAAAVKAALIAEGVPEDSIGTWGYGEDDLAVWTEDNVRERMNRRVEILFE